MQQRYCVGDIGPQLLAVLHQLIKYSFHRKLRLVVQMLIKYIFEGDHMFYLFFQIRLAAKKLMNLEPDFGVFIGVKRRDTRLCRPKGL